MESRRYKHDLRVGKGKSMISKHDLRVGEMESRIYKPDYRVEVKEIKPDLRVREV